ncbi:MAG TPA: hypothetical protein VKU41_05835, partial [Polyangiaceae bacterium]|nr:hypothetical protein [Polyangiaceae bacterium]
MMRHRRSLIHATTPALLALALVLGSQVADGARPHGKPRPAQNPSSATPAPPDPAPAQAIPGGTVPVTIVEVAGSRAYLQPGAAAGVRRGSTVVLSGKDYPVVDANDSYAVLEAGGESLHEQDKGRATVLAQQEQKAAELPKPRPLETWEHAWQPEVAPAVSQQPRFVPLGDVERSRRFDVRFGFAAGGLIPIGGQLGSALALGELDTRLHAEPLDAPLTIDLDASLQGWAAADLAKRVGGSTRPILYVRELLAGVTLGGLHAGVGRMRYAASTLGTLDGVRVEDRLGEGFSIGAFGGLLPDPLSGAASLDAQRFGVEGRYSRPDLDLRPEGAVVLHGSTFQGAVDERRLSGVFGLYPGLSRFGGHFEISNFDANNPWGASRIELTAAGIDQSVRLGHFEIGGRFDLRQPERSRWLSTFLPVSWFCTTAPAPPTSPAAPDRCNGSSDTRAFGEIDGSLTVDNASFVAGALTE